MQIEEINMGLCFARKQIVYVFRAVCVFDSALFNLHIRIPFGLQIFKNQIYIGQDVHSF